MLAEQKIRCRVIAVPVSADTLIDEPTSGLEKKPSELLPWADPYIAALVNKLQDEVRAERKEQRFDNESSAEEVYPLFGHELADFQIDASELETRLIDESVMLLGEAEMPWQEIPWSEGQHDGSEDQPALDWEGRGHV